MRKILFILYMCVTILNTSNSHSQKSASKSKDCFKNQDNLFIVEKDRKYGIINQNQKIIQPFLYSEINLTENKLIITNIHRELYGLVDKKGKEIVKPNYSYIDYISGGLLRLELNEKWGVCNEKGEIIIPVIYDNVKDFSEGLICVELNGKYGFKNKAGKTIIPFKYQEASNFSEGLASVKIKDKYGFIDKHNKLIIVCKYDEASDFSEELALVERNEKKYFINKRQDIIHLKQQYDWISNFSEGRAAVMLNNKWGYINQFGKEIIPLIYDNNFGEDFQSDFKEERALVINDIGKWGFIDKNGQEVIPLIYDYAEPFFNSKSYVRIDDDCFYINKNGLKIQQKQIDNEKFEYVEINEKWGIKGKDGEVIIPIIYDSVLMIK